MKRNVWKALIITFPQDDAGESEEIFSAFFSRFDICGIHDFTADGRRVWGVYFEFGKMPANLADDFRREAESRGIRLARPPSVEVVPREDWHSNWRAYFKPLTASARIRVIPAWDKSKTSPAPPGAVNIFIEPGMAFGTGTHATTRLCLMLADKCIRGGERIIDAGTGSAILAIAAVKLGARSAIGFDNDPDIEENARINISLNDVEPHRIRILVGGVESVSGREFDLAFCNMLSVNFTPLLSPIRTLLKPGATLILSGFLLTETEEIQERLAKAGYGISGFESLEEWGALAARAT
ncbi:MAG: 50S ribosomal protein L11 methyltransferase [bacterium]